jgi:hypothetical protein
MDDAILYLPHFFRGEDHGHFAIMLFKIQSLQVTLSIRDASVVEEGGREGVRWLLEIFR